jgi:hypothetical protein
MIDEAIIIAIKNPADAKKPPIAIPPAALSLDVVLYCTNNISINAAYSTQAAIKIQYGGNKYVSITHTTIGLKIKRIELIIRDTKFIIVYPQSKISNNYKTTLVYHL